MVFHEGRWHLFGTIRSEKRTHQIEYLNFEKWEEADGATRHILHISEGYFCAPQVFYFTPHRRWYMVLQISMPGRPVQLQPAYSTSTNIADPHSWSKPLPLYAEHPSNIKGWIDFWVICDSAKAHLFFTSNNGKFWRAETSLQDFPQKWSPPGLVLEADIFEASCTYALKSSNSFLTLIEAERGPRRYYKAYIADSLDGNWRPLADSWEKSFASRSNVRFPAGAWSDNISHGELLRTGIDEKLEVDGSNLTFLYQGVSDANLAGRPYGQIPWSLGLLRMDSSK